MVHGAGVWEQGDESGKHALSSLLAEKETQRGYTVLKYRHL